MFLNFVLTRRNTCKITKTLRRPLNFNKEKLVVEFENKKFVLGIPNWQRIIYLFLKVKEISMQFKVSNNKNETEISEPCSLAY